MGKDAKIIVSKNGPYLVSGKLPLVKEIIEIGSDGEPARWCKSESYPSKESYALCRCG
ncbi:MAG: CDGSH iron-sulfur domain-containing protein, partial [Candidatus Omnitrophica bacterium]|nr:CDGSH iron-sulfur domain-containing protein [Candidatus Omnitrophota bacterium]